MTVWHFLSSVAAGVLVFVVGLFFDKTPENRYAGLAGLATFVIVLLGLARLS